MLRPEDVERLSALLEGDLPPGEAKALEAEVAARPELAQALSRLRVLAAYLPPPARLDALGERALLRAVARPAPSLGRLMAVAASVLVAAGAAWWAWPDAPSPVERVVEAQRTAPARVEPWPGAVVVEEGAAVVRLTHGTAVFNGPVTVLARDQRVEVRGRALVTVEPSLAAAHATSSATQTEAEAAMVKTQATQWAAAVVAVLVFSGEADAQGRLGAGQQRAVPGAQAVVTQAGPIPGKVPPPPSEVFDLLEVNEAVLAQRAALLACFEAGLKQEPALAGTLPLRLRIRANGALEDASVEGEVSLHHPFVTACVVEALGKVKFPGARGVAWAQLDYPLRFSARGTAGELLLPTAPGDSQRVLVNDRAGRFQVDLGQAPTDGPADARVTVVLFGDGVSSFSLSAQQVLRQVRAEYAGKVRFAWKHRPLTPKSPGQQAALALVAAHAQGRFWDYLEHEAVVSSEAGFDAWDARARALGLDLQRFRRDRAAARAAEVVSADVAQAEQLKVQSVPTWFINGQEVVGHRPLETMRELLDAALKAPAP